MRACFLLFLALVSTITISIAQVRFERTYGGALSDLAEAVRQTYDGGYVIGGSTSSFGAGIRDMFLVRTNSVGDSLWARTYGGASDEEGFAVQQTSDSGFIMVGSTSSFGAGLNDVYLVRTNSLGDTLWTRTYGGAYDDGGQDVHATSDGGYIITGFTVTSQSGPWHLYLVKTDSGGDTLWTRTFGGTSLNFGNAVRQTADDGFVVAGYTTPNGSAFQDMYLVKTDSLGDTLWTRTYGGALFEGGGDVEQTSDGGYIVVGNTSSFGAGHNDVYLVKTNSLGDTLWTRTFGGANDDGGQAIQATSDGGFIFAGYTQTAVGGPWDVYLVRTDASGDSLWTRRFGGASDDFGNALQKASDGGYVIAGFSSSFGGGTNQMYLVKTDGNGLLADVATQDLARLPSEFLLNQNYPNPFNPITTISYDLPKRDHVRLSVFNMLGQEIASLVNEGEDAGFKSVSFDARNLPSGVYTYRLSVGSFVAVRKMIYLK